MDQFPDFSDLSNIGQDTRLSWENEYAIRDRYKQYYTGRVFQKTVPAEDGSEEEVEIFPVGLNLVKMLCHAQADSIFGEWEEDIVSFEPLDDAATDENNRNAAKFIQGVMRRSGANHFLWEAALDREIYGGTVLRIAPALRKNDYIRWSRVPIDSFFPIWDPEDPDRLLEVYIIYEITKDQAAARYGYVTDKDSVKRISHWTLSNYEEYIDGNRMDAYSGSNLWGVAPFVFIPRMRSTHWWGDSLTEDIIRVQDELNLRIADLGEALNYNSHPTRYGVNLKKAFNADNFPLGPNIFWDIGSELGGTKPEVGILEAKNPLPEQAFNYLNFLYDWSRVSSSAPPVVFGEDSSGSQRSGITLELRMWPLIKATRRSRAYLSDGLVRALDITARILQQKKFPGIRPEIIDSLKNLAPKYASIMPRDQAAIVDEVQKGMSTPVPTISLETAVKKLNYGASEVSRIEEMVKSDMYENSARQSKLTGMNAGSGNVPK